MAGQFEHNLNQSVQTVQQYAQEGKAGLPLGPKGPAPAKLSPHMLTEAIVSHVGLNQINQEGNKKKRINLLESIQKLFN